MRTLTFEIEGMHCENCAARLERALRQASRVRSATVAFAGQFAHVAFEPQATGEAELERLIELAGYAVAVCGS